jgi:hypothetical protein
MPQPTINRHNHSHPQQRREKDEQRLLELRANVAKLDKALTAEIKRGLERNRGMQAVGYVRVILSVGLCYIYIRNTHVTGPERLTSICIPPQWAEEQLEGLQAALAGKLEERAKEAGDRLDVLQRRVDTLEEVGGLCWLDGWMVG